MCKNASMCDNYMSEDVFHKFCPSPEEGQERTHCHSNKKWDVSKEVGEQRIHVLIQAEVIWEIEA